LNYLLDTNACIAVINGKPITVRDRFQKAFDAGAQLNVSTRDEPQKFSQPA
jgi:predicted nucleic acid-binding protein